jgi:hypothetical protein
MSRYPAPAPVDDFVLLFLPPCGPHLTPLATESLESVLLVSPFLRGPTRHRPFAPTLHLHQRKSSRNLHLQYSAKSQSTPRCQSLITARSDHPPVLGRPSPQGSATPPPSPASMMAHLTPCACFRKKKLLDLLLGDQTWWCWIFLGAAVDEVLGRLGFILTRRRTVKRPVTRLGTRIRSGELLATKRVMWSQGDM